MQSLKEIVTAEEIVFFDSSVANMRSFSNEFRGTGLGFEPELLERDIDNLREVTDFLNEGNVYTSYKVVHELEAAKDMLCKKLKSINREQKRIEREGKKFRIVEEDTVLSLNKLTLLMRDIVKLARRKEYKTSDDFPNIDSVFCLLGRYTKPKRKGNQRIRFFDYRTDETLLATAYYAALKERKAVCIVTQDSDFMRMLPIIHAQLTAYGFDNERIFEKLMQENPVKVYVGDEEGYNLYMSTREIVPADYFNLKNVPKLRMKKIKKNTQEKVNGLSERRARLECLLYLVFVPLHFSYLEG